jgi:hypothetical protein
MRITNEDAILACTVSCILLHSIDCFTIQHNVAARIILRSDSTDPSATTLNIASTPDDFWDETDRELRIPFIGTTSPLAEEAQTRDNRGGFLSFLRRKQQAREAITTVKAEAALTAKYRSDTKKCPVPAFILDMIPKDESDYRYDEPTTVPLNLCTSAAQPQEVTARAGKCPVPAFLHNFLPHNGHGRSPTLRVSSRQQKQQDASVPVGRVETTKAVAFSRLEEWAVLHLDEWYQLSQSIHCPFFRRRSGDALDALESFIKHVIVRPECWPLMGEPQACRDPKASRMVAARHRGLALQNEPREQEHKQREQRNVMTMAINKQRGLSLAEIEEILRKDWRASTTDKGYYVTGRMTTSIYRNDCYFDGPDPDMPIRGLRKYMGVASNLFDAKKSTAKLFSLNQVKDKDKSPLDASAGGEQMIAHWQMEGVLKLPWRPEMPPIVGTTTYFLDTDGLIERHVETWNVSPVHAFCHTLFPRVAKAVWGGGDDKGLIPAFHEIRTTAHEFMPLYHELTCGVFAL